MDIKRLQELSGMDVLNEGSEPKPVETRAYDVIFAGFEQAYVIFKKEYGDDEETIRGELYDIAKEMLRQHPE